MTPLVPLARVVAADSFAARVVAITARLATAIDEAEAVGVLHQAAATMGADAAAFVSFVRDDDAHDTFRFLLACDPVWCAEYERRAWYALDPWLAYARAHTEPVRSADVPAEAGVQREIVELARRHGFSDALIVPAPASGMVTRLGVLCLGSEHEGFFGDEGYAILKPLARSLAMELHAWWIERIKRELARAAQLTEEDLLLLRHERQGRGTKAIASELAASPNAINSRFQRMNARLGVPNRKAAAQLAAEYGLI
ncbi:MAG: autoinducer binding domain-containing protein [Burkholderiaceae bacterium]|nr:autoinducer binding domain-containing protein [Burkholderiaceae bacterium]